MRANLLSPTKLWVGLILAAAILACLLSEFSPKSASPAAAAQPFLGGTALSGRLEILWADGQPGTGLSETHYRLVRPGEPDVELQFGAALPLPIDQLLRARDHWVTLSGAWLADGFRVAGVTTVQSADPAPVSAPLVSGSQPWVSVMCKFNDVAAEPKNAAYFQTMYGSTYPLLDHYWREQSYNLVNIVGSTSTIQWYTLPHPRSYYIYDMNGDSKLDADLNRLTNDCTAVADSAINYTAFLGINLMFNANLDNYAWGGSRYMTLDGSNRRWYMTWEPPWGYDDITVIAHEMGHGFGLPHSSFNRSSVYDNRWDVMSDTWTDCGNLSDATYGCLGQHTIAYHKDLEGWLAGKQASVSAGNQQTFTLEQLAQPQTANLLLIKIPIQGSSQFYTVEVRRKVGYDVKLPGQAVILHLIDPSQGIPAQLIDPDGDNNTGDAGAMWLPGETFSDATNAIWVRVDSATATGFVVTISNRFTGTPTPTPTATATFTSTPTPIPTITPTPTATVNPALLTHHNYIPVLEH
jgi:M6 family metalloprotease-like protein